MPEIILWRKASGVSLCTPPFGPATVRSLALRCSTTFFMKEMKCSARRIFPGTASFNTSGLSTFCKENDIELGVDGGKPNELRKDIIRQQTRG